MSTIDNKKTNAIGYGAICLYCALIGFIAWGVYGFNAIPLMGESADTATAARPVKGKMLIATEDRVRCREYSFDNETQQITAGGLIYCDENWNKLTKMSPSVNGIRDAFGKR